MSDILYSALKLIIQLLRKKILKIKNLSYSAS